MFQLMKLLTLGREVILKCHQSQCHEDLLSAPPEPRKNFLISTHYKFSTVYRNVVFHTSVSDALIFEHCSNCIVLALAWQGGHL